MKLLLENWKQFLNEADYFKGSKFGDDQGRTFSVEKVNAFAKENEDKYLEKSFDLDKVKHELKYWEEQADKLGKEESTRRMEKTDTSYPILVIREDGHLSVADGLNRLKKMISIEEKTKADVYVIPKEDILHLKDEYRMKLLIENWRKLLNEISFEDAKKRLETKALTKWIKGMAFDEETKTMTLNPDQIEAAKNELAKLVLEFVPEDLTDNQKGTTLEWIISVGINVPEMKQSFYNAAVAAVETDSDRFPSSARADLHGRRERFVLERYWHTHDYSDQKDIFSIKTWDSLAYAAEKAKKKYDAAMKDTGTLTTFPIKKTSFPLRLGIALRMRQKKQRKSMTMR